MNKRLTFYCILQHPEVFGILGGRFLGESINIYVTASIARLLQRPLSEREVVGSNPVAAPYQK